MKPADDGRVRGPRTGARHGWGRGSSLVGGGAVLLLLLEALLLTLRLRIGGGQIVRQARHLSVQGVPRLP